MNNDARMTIRLPGEMLIFAQNYAQERQLSLSELVLRYFKRLKDSLKAKDDDIPASVRDVVGILPPSVDVKRAYREHLAEKYL